MSVPVLTFFNNKGGVGKTSLVYHLAWMMSDMGKHVVAIDLDPQANLTSAFFPEDELEVLWDTDSQSPTANTIFQCVLPLTEVGDIKHPQTKRINPRLHLVPGDLSLAGFEDFLSKEWPHSLDSGSLYRPFRVLSAFWQVAQLAAQQHNADLILADVGPNLGAINRSAVIASDYVVIPLAADLFSLQGLRNLGPTLRGWRADWQKRVTNWTTPAYALPRGAMQPVGYVIQQYAESHIRPLKAYNKWADRIPSVYRESILSTPPDAIQPEEIQLASDPNCLARLRHYRSLVPMAHETRKPIFHLTAVDGAIGAHSVAAKDARGDFAALAQTILDRMGMPE